MCTANVRHSHQRPHLCATHTSRCCRCCFSSNAPPVGCTAAPTTTRRRDSRLMLRTSPPLLEPSQLLRPHPNTANTPTPAQAYGCRMALLGGPQRTHATLVCLGGSTVPADAHRRPDHGTVIDAEFFQLGLDLPQLCTQCLHLCIAGARRAAAAAVGCRAWPRGPVVLGQVRHRFVCERCVTYEPARPIDTPLTLRIDAGHCA